MAIPIDLAGKVIVLSGAARGGISGATARQLARAGATIVAIDQAQSILDETIADVESLGGKCHGMVANLMNPAETDPIAETVFARFGRLDGVANVAGGTKEQEWMPLEQTPTEQFRETLNLNLEYVFRMCRDAAAAMIKHKTAGSLVNVGSISALTSAPWHGPYGAAKSGISALTRTMAFEWHDFGIRANTVSPGAVYTQRIRDRKPVANVTSNVSDIWWATVDDLANAIVFLLSDLASGISGQTLVVDSGLSTKFCSGNRASPKT